MCCQKVEGLLPTGPPCLLPTEILTNSSSSTILLPHISLVVNFVTVLRSNPLNLTWPWKHSATAEKDLAGFPPIRFAGELCMSADTSWNTKYTPQWESMIGTTILIFNCILCG